MKASVADQLRRLRLGITIIAAVKDRRRAVTEKVCSRMKDAGEDRIECFDNNRARGKLRDLLSGRTRHAHFEAQGSKRIHATENYLSIERPGRDQSVPDAGPGNCEK